jgi:DNA-binding response OmpR family regulator
VEGPPWLAVLVSAEPVAINSVDRLVQEGAVVVVAKTREAVAGVLLGDLTPYQERPSEGSTGPLQVDLRRHEIKCRGTRMDLTENEFRLLSTLITNGDRAFSYEELEEIIWNSRFLGDPARLRSAVKRLRSKLAAITAGVDIECVRGIGFRLSRS